MQRLVNRGLLVLAALAVFVVPVAVSAAGGFTDVADDNIFKADIQWMADNDITRGCNPPTNDKFCPSDVVTRETMSAFMHRLGVNQVVDAKTAVTAETAANADKLDGLDSDAFQPSEVPLGETVRGTIGVQEILAAAGEMMGNSSLPIPAPVGLTDNKVTVAGGGDDTDGACTGSVANPTADPGYVCIYPYAESNVAGSAGALWGAGDGTKWGFQVSVQTTGAGKAWFVANWAYTAPLSLATASAGSGAENTPGVAGN